MQPDAVFCGTHDKRAKAAVIEWMIGQRSVMGHTAKASVAMSLGAYRLHVVGLSMMGRQLL